MHEKSRLLASNLPVLPVAKSTCGNAPTERERESEWKEYLSHVVGARCKSCGGAEMKLFMRIRRHTAEATL